MARKRGPRLGNALDKQRVANGQKLTELVHDWLIAHGAEHDRYGKLVIDTVLSKLTVVIVDDWIAQSFADEKRATAAATRVGSGNFGPDYVLHGEYLNPYSGKFNFGCGTHEDAEALFTRWSRSVSRILPEHVLQNRDAADAPGLDDSAHEWLPGIGPRAKQ